MTTVTVIECTSRDELYCQFHGQSGPQDCYVSLDCEGGELGADYDGEIGPAMPASVWHGRTKRWGIPCLTADAANALLRAIAPLAQQVLDGFDVEWDGHNHVGRFDAGHSEECECEWRDAADAHEGSAAWAIEQIGALCEQASDADQVQVWHAADWLGGVGGWEAQCASVGITAATTDAELAATETRLESEADGEGVTLEGLRGHLGYLRERAIDALPECAWCHETASTTDATGAACCAACAEAYYTTDGVRIEPADWVVGGETADDLDCGEVQREADGTLEVAWQSGVRTALARRGEVLTVYATQSAAQVAFDRASAAAGAGARAQEGA